MRPTTASIQRAEFDCRAEMSAIVADLSSLHSRALALKDDCSRLTELKEQGADLERAVRFAVEKWRVDGQESRPKLMRESA